MRRSLLATVLLTLVVALPGSAVGGEKPAQPAAQKKSIVRTTPDAKADSNLHRIEVTLPQPADLVSDTVSGCVRGAALAKVLIDLQRKEKGCVPEVTPASVCVAPGGTVRFKIRYGCGLGGQTSVEIGTPNFKRRLDGHTDDAERPAIFSGCSPQPQLPEPERIQVVHCDVSEYALPGFYKYSLSQKGVFTLDPDVEVHQ